MDRQLIWAIKSQSISNTRKKLKELSEREDLFDVSSVDTQSEEYKRTVRSFEKARRTGTHIVTYIDSEYPASLRMISRPPALLYVRGNKEILNGIVYVGIVGARETDDYGIRMAESIASEIGENGIGIASGGARGIDAASHRGALRAKAPTIAVLGSGLDRPYPEENIPLFKKIVENGGAVITEYPFGMEPLPNNFPRRNRIISGLSSALVVVRAAYRSGSLITAHQAMEQGISVYAVPGNIDNKLSAGTNELIRDGATPLLSAMDVVDELIERVPDFFVMEMDKREKEAEELRTEKKTEKKLNLEGLSEYEKEIVEIIISGAQTQNLIEEKISFGAERLTALLGMMEIKGIIKKGPDKKYIIL
ncbi:MAG: DNA-protecting protein DprA [Ruminococcaceae bacterium]|nr:DNA-protecting protein DprA [Oscillospiraceae bacterium]